MYMKTLIRILFLTGWCAPLIAQDKVEITGSIQGVPDHTPVLLFGQNNVVDSARVNGGKFRLSASAEGGGIFRLLLPEYQRQGSIASQELYLEPGQVSLKASGPLFLHVELGGERICEGSE